MSRKILTLTLLLTMASMTASAGFKLGNVLKKPADSSSGGLPVSANRDYQKEREQQLQKLFDEAPDKEYRALTKYFEKKLGAKAGYKNAEQPESYAPTWFVRTYKDNTSEYCLLFSLSNVQSSMASTAEREANNGSVKFGSSKCDHPWTSWAPVVMDFMN